MPGMPAPDCGTRLHMLSARIVCAPFGRSGRWASSITLFRKLPATIHLHGGLSRPILAWPVGAESDIQQAVMLLRCAA